MKPIILMFSIAVLISTDAQAQSFRRFHQRIEKARAAPRPSALKVIGITSIPVGCAVSTVGCFIYIVEGDTGGRGSNTSIAPKENYTGIIVMGAGGVLVLGGITMLIIDRSHTHTQRWSIITPKNNEIGLAYNF